MSTDIPQQQQQPQQSNHQTVGATPVTEPPSDAQVSQLSSQSQQQDLSESQQKDPSHIATVSDGGRELSKTVLYVGNIHRSIPDLSLQELFTSLGNPIKSLKILQDKNKPGFSYAFVEFESPDFADHALSSLDNTIIGDNQLKITKAFQTQQVKNNETFNLFVGDLSLEINDDLLYKNFEKFSSLVQANVMWDMKSGRSRGYGFVCFAEKSDAEDALASMNGVVLGDRQIRLNWASHRSNNSTNINNNNNNHFNNNNSYHNRNNYHHHNNNNINHYNNNMNHTNSNNPNMLSNYPQQLYNNVMSNEINKNMNQLNNENGGVANNVEMMNISMMHNNSNNISDNSILMNNSSSNNMNLPSMNMNQMINQLPPQVITSPPSYEMVLNQTPNWLTVVYLGNLAEYTTQNDLIPLLQNFGYIVNFKLLSDKNCAFVTYDTHERAALAIVQLSGFTINGRPLKCGWGKGNRPNSNMRNNLH